MEPATSRHEGYLAVAAKAARLKNTAPEPSSAVVEARAEAPVGKAEFFYTPYFHVKTDPPLSTPLINAADLASGTSYEEDLAVYYQELGYTVVIHPKGEQS